MIMEMRFDKENNRIVIEIDGEEPILISPQAIRDLLPTISEEEKIKDLEMIIHDIDREKLTNMRDYIAKMKELDSEINKVREELTNCEKAICVKKWGEVIKSYIAQKNALAEIRRAIGLLEKDKKELRIRIAKLETGIKE